MNKIHKTAMVDPAANLGDNVTVGPYSIVNKSVKIGDNTTIGAHCLIDEYTEIGSSCKIFTGAVVGSVPQDLKFNGEVTNLVIGDNTIIREYVTINRATKNGGSITRVGSNVLLMAYAHVAHDCTVEDNAILANAVTLAGHVHICDHAIIGGLTPIHQFTRIGRFAFVGGASRVSQDILPFMRAAGSPLEVIGLNSVGLQRHGYSDEKLQILKQVYKIIFRDNLNTSQAIEKLKTTFDTRITEIKEIIEFIETSERGISK